MRILPIIVLLASVLPLIGQDLPEITRRVQDEAGVLSTETIATLTGELKALEESDSTQVVVLVVKSIGQRSLEEFSLEVATRAGIGQQHRDNGVLMVVVTDDRRMRTEVGPGLQGVLTDGLCSQIHRREMKASLASGAFDEGVSRGVRAIVAAVRGEYVATGETSSRGFRLPFFGVEDIVAGALLLIGLLLAFTPVPAHVTRVVLALAPTASIGGKLLACGIVGWVAIIAILVGLGAWITKQKWTPIPWLLAPLLAVAAASPSIESVHWISLGAMALACLLGSSTSRSDVPRRIAALLALGAIVAAGFGLSRNLLPLFASTALFSFLTPFIGMAAGARFGWNSGTSTGSARRRTTDHGSRDSSSDSFSGGGGSFDGGGASDEW